MPTIKLKRAAARWGRAYFMFPKEVKKEVTNGN